MNAPTHFLTIAGRWKQKSEASGIDKLPSQAQAMAMLMFYAGFGASMEAHLEVAAFDETEACRLLSALHIETQQMASMAERIVSGGTLS